MKNIILAFAAAALIAGCDCGNPVSEISAVSPDGKNEIKLYANPLAYEVFRNGKCVVARTEVGLVVDGTALAMKDGGLPCGKTEALSGSVETPVYKNSSIDFAANRSTLCFGDWGLQAVARNDGVAYRFVLKKDDAKVITCEKAGLVIPDGNARCWFNRTTSFGNEETIPECADANVLPSDEKKLFYLPFVYSVNGACVAVTESNLRSYPVRNLSRDAAAPGGVLDSVMPKFPKSTYHKAGWGNKPEDICEKGGRWVCVKEEEDFITKAGGELPWRVFVLGDRPSDLMSADIVNALATPAAAGSDFSWVRPGKVAWDWWNAFDNIGDPQGCTTKTYERFIDFAAKNGVEYVIFDEGWSAKLDIWEFSPVVDVPHLIEYANSKGVGIILWMAWAQVCGDEAHVAEHFAKLGAKGFKVDFMDRGDADVTDFLEKFAAECAKNHMLVDFHGAYRPVGLSRTYPNVVNYEGIHGLEQMKWFRDDPAKMMYNDVAACFLRMTAGPLDYTPGAMLNFPVTDDSYSQRKDNNTNPGSVGTRCHQMAMMAMYEAPLQMLADSPTHYEANMECFSFMAKVPVTWQKTVGLGGCPESYAAVARQAKDGSWYVAVLNGFESRKIELDTGFLGDGEWKCEFFSDAADSDKTPTNFTHGNVTVKAGSKVEVTLAPGGGYIAHLVR